MQRKLSICIPTFNRAEFLAIALNSIYTNISKDQKDIIEILVSDNCSDDATETVVNSFNEKIPIKYNKNAQNVGAEENFRIVLSLAKGEYVWLFGDDDSVVIGAISYLLDFLLKNKDIGYAFFPRILADKNLSWISDEVQPKGLNGDHIFDSGYTLLGSYDKQLTGLIGFLGSVVIRRDLFNVAMDSMKDEELHRQWTFLRIIFKAIIKQKCAVLGKPGVICRLNNSRPFTTVSSETWFDDYIALYQFAKKIGYPEEICNYAIKSIIIAFSKSFVIDKAKGHRNDNISSALSKLDAQDLKVKKQPWYFFSFLPGKILHPLMKAFFLFRCLSRQFK